MRTSTDTALLRAIASAVILTCFPYAALSQRSETAVTVSGHITDRSNGETLIGAGVTCGPYWTVTNDFGFYSITVPEGNVQIGYSYVGYSGHTIALTLRKDTTVNVSLVPDSRIMEARVSARTETGVGSTKMSYIDIPAATIRDTPTLLGEPDVLKTIQLMPGVQNGIEGFSGIYVRGGGPDENLLLLDGIPLYNAEHMLGLFSIFPGASIKKVTLWKGSFPARYGGRTSSIIDVRTNDGNLHETHGSIGIGVLCDRLHLEGPILRGKTSYSFSLRGMHTFMMDGLLKALKIPANYYFYDVDAKATHTFSDTDRLSVNFYNGRDVFRYSEESEASDQNPWGYEDKTGIRWGNTLAAARWNHIYSGRLFSNTTFALTSYSMLMDIDLTDSENSGVSVLKRHIGSDYGSGINDLTLKTDFDWSPSISHMVRFGGGYVHHSFIPDTYSVIEHETDDGKVQTDATFSSGDIVRSGNEVSLFIEDDFQAGRFSFDPGIHLSLFLTEGRAYLSPEPRMNARYDIGRNFSLKAGYSRMSQYFHLLSSSLISLPADLWVPVTSNIKPVTSDQWSSGLFYDGLPGWESSIEGYWKRMHNVLEYKDGVSFLGDSSGWENEVAMGEGRAYGAELSIRKTAGKTTGWLGYTLAWSDRIFPDSSINGGRRFPYRYDRRHCISLVVNHRFTETIDLAATWTFSSGGATSIPEREVVLQSKDGSFTQIDYSGLRNNWRLPPSHHLNFGVNFHRKKKHGESVWNLGVYNAYDRMNPNFVYYSSENNYETDTGLYSRKGKLKSVTILPLIPSSSYTWNF